LGDPVGQESDGRINVMTDGDTEHQQPIVNIVGDRVALGPMRSDLLPLYTRWRNDFWVQRTFGDQPSPVTRERREKWLDDVMSSTGDFWFTVYERVGEELIPIGIADLFNVDFRFSVAQFGMMIGEASSRGKGLGTEVVRLMLDYAFTALGLSNVMLTVAEYNLAGRRAYEKAGFKEMGRRRQADRMNGVVYDEIYMDCVASEFTSPVLAKIFVPDEPR
jgi:RimJ/RimL family protein N-acetyltransferase